MSKHNHTSPLDRFIRDKDGHVTLAQMPNLPLIGWAVFGILAFIVAKGTLHTGFSGLSRAWLFTWAYLEIRSGDSPARRVLGGLVMLMLVAGFFRN